MTPFKKNIIAFFIWIFIWANSIFALWLSGNNFDHRGPDMVTWYIITGIISFVICVIARGLMDMPHD